MENGNLKEVKIEDFYSKVLGLVGKNTILEISQILQKINKTVAVAESVTGGKISSMLTTVAGSSDFFIGGIVAYSNRIKVQELAVSPKVIAEMGAVSREVAVFMAEGIKKRFKTDIGLGITGCAGPDPLPPAPVGLVFVAISTEEGTRCEELVLQGGREEIREKSVDSALGLLLFELEKLQGQY